MLKKVIIGILCVVILAVTGGGIYLYMLDWNQHKSMVEQRFSQITGLKAVIEGRLSVELFPSPKFSANRVKFYKPSNTRDPLVAVNDISANVELWPLFSQKFILSAMNLSNATVFVNIDKEGILNWKGVGASNKNKSGNIEVSFNGVHLTGSTFSYKNEKDNKEFEIPNISASISAPSLNGPYKTDGKFIHNNSEIKFNGNIVKNDNLSVNLMFQNAATSSKISLEGSLGANANGVVTLDTAHLTDLAAVIFGKDALSERYQGTLYTSFKYNYNQDVIKLDNFTVAFRRDTKGTGSVIIKKNKQLVDFIAAFDMAHFDLDILENICEDVVKYAQSGAKFSDMKIANYNGELNLKSGDALYRGVAAQNFNLNLSLQNNVLNFSRYGIDLPGDTNIKGVGKIDLNNNFNYQFDQVLKTNDLRVFASIFGINLGKLAAEENKKSIFKKSNLISKIVGDLNKITLTIPEATIDGSEVKGNLGFVKNDGKVFVIADVYGSKVLFDKYMLPFPDSMNSASLEEKLVHQFKLIPWDHAVNVDAKISVDFAVYNKVPLEGISLEFNTVDDTLKVKQLSIENIAGAALNLALDATNIYTAPSFKELSYDIKTTNLPQFTSTLGIDVGDKPLFSKKLFASQGALSGTLTDFSLSSVQKFDNTEFSYTGTITKLEKTTAVSGSLELKTTNFVNLIHDLNLDYTPDMPVTSFTLSGDIKGTTEVFALEKIDAHLGANAITGQFQLDNSEKTPKLVAKFDFDKFDANRFFNLSKKDLLPSSSEKDGATFIAKPEFDDTKIDYAFLKDVDFNIQATAKQFTFKNKLFADTSLDASLKDGNLKVTDFKTQNDENSVSLQFILNSNSLPKVQGNFALKSINIPDLGGATYVLEASQLDADGSFDSLASSQKAFFENLNSRGKIQVSGTAVKGWDLDIIKFDFEQRKSVEGFEETILNNLRSGRSIFNKVSGKYEITKGLITAENIVWESPVANISMKFNLNLSDWLFSAVFNAIYHNASFSDVLKFTFGGNLATPTVKVDLSESIHRISETENMVKNAKNKEEKARLEKISQKAENLENRLNEELQEISRMTLDVVRFKPITDNANVNNIYNTNLSTLQDIEKKLKQLLSLVRTNPSEKVLMSVEAELSVEKSKLKFVPKTLEDNFIVDSKYVFDNTFNKIAWVYNVAQNNFSYYDNLTAEYVKQIQLLDETDNPVADEQKEQLSEDVKSVADEMELITALHNKIRENYLSIIDATNVAEMNENNDIAAQALQTILTYVDRMNTKIVDSIDDFRAILNISTRDYDQYMVYPPKNPEDIDVKKSTTPSAAEKVKTEEKNTPQESSTLDVTVDEKVTEAEDAKKKDGNLTLNVLEIAPNEAPLTEIIKESNSKYTGDTQALEITFNGLSQLIKKETSEPLTDTAPSMKELVMAETIPLVEKDAVSFDDELLEITKASPSEIKITTDSPLKTAILVTEEQLLPMELAGDFDIEAIPENIIVQPVVNDSDYTASKEKSVIALELDKSAPTVIQEDISVYLDDKAIAETDVASIESTEIVSPVVEYIQEPVKKLAPAALRRKTLQRLLLTARTDKQFQPYIRKYVKNAPIHIKNPDKINNNKYVFTTSSPVHQALKGTISKSMLLEKEVSPLSEPVEKKYIVATNGHKLSYLSGTVHKNTSLFSK